MGELNKEERDELLLDFAEQAMAALIPTFGDLVETHRGVIAHKAFLLADSMVSAYEQRNWEKHKAGQQG